MKAIQLLVAIFFALVALDAHAGNLEFKNAGAHSALYSFADVYRLTVGGAAGGAAGFALGESAFAPAPAVQLTPVAQSSAEFTSRAAAAEPQAPSFQISIVAVPEPQRGLLLLSGLALMVWVARRRLLQSF